MPTKEKPFQYMKSDPMSEDQTNAKLNFKEYTYRIEHKAFEIVVLHDKAKHQLQLFYKTNRMQHFRPLMDGENWLTFDARYLSLAVMAANEAAAGMIHDYERERS